MNSPLSHKALRYFFFHVLLIFFCSTLFRIYLLVSLPKPNLSSLLQSFGLSLLFDSAVALYSFLPIAIFLFFSILLIRRPGFFRKTFFALAFLELFFFLFLTLCEFFFFQ